jgi:hypothetical protein
MPCMPRPPAGASSAYITAASSWLSSVVRLLPTAQGSTARILGCMGSPYGLPSCCRACTSSSRLASATRCSCTASEASSSGSAAAAACTGAAAAAAAGGCPSSASSAPKGMLLRLWVSLWYPATASWLLVWQKLQLERLQGRPSVHTTRWAAAGRATSKSCCLSSSLSRSSSRPPAGGSLKGVADVAPSLAKGLRARGAGPVVARQQLRLLRKQAAAAAVAAGQAPGADVQLLHCVAACCCCWCCCCCCCCC